MSAARPTAVPWSVSGSLIVNDAGTVIARVCGRFSLKHYLQAPADYHNRAPDAETGEPRENERRIVACVNACDGLEIPAGVEAGGVTHAIELLADIHEATLLDADDGELALEAVREIRELARIALRSAGIEAT